MMKVRVARRCAWKKSRKAAIGIGTLIVFIALVLVAAIAGAVIVKTANSLKNIAEATGKGASKEVSGSVKIMDITGDRNNPIQANIQQVYFTVSTWDGSRGIDMRTMVIHWEARSTNVYLTFDPANPVATATTYGWATVITTAGSGWNPAGGQYFLDDDTVLQLTIDLGAGAVNDPLPPNTYCMANLVPGSGPVVLEEFATPSAYGAAQFIDLTNA